MGATASPSRWGKWDQRCEAEMLTGATTRRYRKRSSDKSSRISPLRAACRERPRTAAAANGAGRDHRQLPPH